ncbi:hypothetical protein COU76_00440 [Candidatus Peregrinibacteria bacterium CG10_big_fil_rev_8_21_14_0_10_49_10]|nr:MAG: hypothetical protein COU76_00440 [Candidatus Peregrinibacteria bacterium CG10_big_fil_rev_8_21_14_0_10_49_10]
MTFISFAAVALGVIIVTSLFVSDLRAKIAVFLGTLGLTYCGLHLFGGHIGHEVLHEVFMVDYVQFIPIPVSTVLIAALGLFAVNPSKETKLGWFLWFICPIAGNFGTTWALVPVGLSLMPTLKRLYPDRWLMILITVCAFSMNFMALGTLAADPPQAYWAVKVSESGSPLGFFFPVTQFWLYMSFTMALYACVLKRLGVEFGGFTDLIDLLRSVHVGKALFGTAIAATVGLSITFLQGYMVTWVLGTTCVVVGICGFVFFGHEEQHRTIHWSLETATIFLAFFSVVALAHRGLHDIQIGNQGMVGAVIALTLGADNAAAFAAAYPQFAALGRMYLVWFNLFPAVTFGGLSPLGNGPQIALFLVILVSMNEVTSKQVFVTWFREACVFAPYLLFWAIGISTVIEWGQTPTVAVQILIGMLGLLSASESMDLQGKYRKLMESNEGN